MKWGEKRGQGGKEKERRQGEGEKATCLKEAARACRSCLSSAIE